VQPLPREERKGGKGLERSYLRRRKKFLLRPRGEEPNQVSSLFLQERGRGKKPRRRPSPERVQLRFSCEKKEGRDGLQTGRCLGLGSSSSGGRGGKRKSRSREKLLAGGREEAPGVPSSRSSSRRQPQKAGVQRTTSSLISARKREKKRKTPLLLRQKAPR